MRILGSKKKKFVRIIVGSGETGTTGLQSPTKQLSLEDTNVDEVFKIIKESIEKKINKLDGKKE